MCKFLYSLPSLLFGYGYRSGAMSFRNEYDGHTLEAALAQVEYLTQRKIKILAGDRGYRGRKEVNSTHILIPDTANPVASKQQRRKKYKLFCKRVGIYPTIGHLKTDHRLDRNCTFSRDSRSSVQRRGC